MTITFSGLLRFARNDERRKAVIASRRRSNPRDVVRRLLLSLAAPLAALTSGPSAGAEQPFITLASTTSTEQSGLFAHLLPAFTAKTGIAVHVVAVGTGQALKIGERGDADVLLVHDKPSELKFVAAGWGVDRHDVMYNDFVVVGPERDPAKVGGGTDAVAAFRKIAAAKAPFVSRGDDSGTDKEEKRLWQEAGIDIKEAGDGWYREAGQGMGPTLNMAAALDAYTLSDRGTWLSFNNRRDLALLVAGDQRLFNQYGVMLVNPARHPTVKAALGKTFIQWLVSPAGQQTIAAYRIGGEQLFFPDARE
jgi:tungstate transport system substrate-binding protein